MKGRFVLFPHMGFALLALFFGLWAGLLRLGWAFPTFPSLGLMHGPLMVSGFLGVLIPLERAVALRQGWMFFAPLFSGIGWITLLVVPTVGIPLMVLGSLGMLAILWVMWRREPKLHTFTLLLGGVTWVGGNLLWWLGRPIFQVVFWWMAFLLLTIAGERLELQRVLRPLGKERDIFSALVGLLLLATLLGLFNQQLASRLIGLVFLALTLWFARFDLAIRNLRHPSPLTRYIAIALASGFGWLGISGILFLRYGAVYAGPLYDAALHGFFVGFVFAMIFGHALLIFPAMLGRQAQFFKLLYLPLALLHASLVLRILGDISFHHAFRQWGGLLNAVVILLFFGLMASSFLLRRR
ncbi:MAG: hypothetical protein ACK4VW_03675 [Anaerolineales bacterium]